jgi:tetratricopeptide (TPR) repeat protein
MWNQRFKDNLAKAEEGDKLAQYQTGNMLLKGQGTPVDEKEAFKWFEKAADAGHTKSRYKLGYLYMNGKGTKKDTRKAYKYISQAADAGYGPAQYQLGRMYSAGEGVSQDYEQAVKWYEKAVASNYHPAEKALENAKRQARAQRKAAAAAKPAPEPVAAPKPARKPVQVASTASKPRVTSHDSSKTSLSAIDIATRMRSTYWLHNGRPTAFLPSAINSCQFSKNKVNCKSGEVTAVLDTADVVYTAESELSQFKSKKTFVLSYKRNFTYVMPLDLDNPNAKVEYREGPEKTSHVYDCTILSDRLIRCRNSKGHQISFTQ